MRNSYRDVAYHCSGKQRNPITGWQLNSLSRLRFSCGRRSESSRPRSPPLSCHPLRVLYTFHRSAVDPTVVLLPVEKGRCPEYLLKGSSSLDILVDRFSGFDARAISSFGPFYRFKGKQRKHSNQFLRHFLPLSYIVCLDTRKKLSFPSK